MIVKLLTEHHLELLSLKGGCRDSSESTLVICQIFGNLMSLTRVLSGDDFQLFACQYRFLLPLQTGWLGLIRIHFIDTLMVILTAFFEREKKK